MELGNILHHLLHVLVLGGKSLLCLSAGFEEYVLGVGTGTGM